MFLTQTQTSTFSEIYIFYYTKVNSFKQMKHISFSNVSPSNFKGFPFQKLERETNTKMIHYNLEYHKLGFLDDE